MRRVASARDARGAGQSSSLVERTSNGNRASSSGSSSSTWTSTSVAIGIERDRVADVHVHGLRVVREHVGPRAVHEREHRDHGGKGFPGMAGAGDGIHGGLLEAMCHDRQAAPAIQPTRQARGSMRRSEPARDGPERRPARECRLARRPGATPKPHPPGDPMTDTLLQKSENNLIWVDMEMTGLFPDTDRIIEVAVVITDPQLTVRVEGPVFAIHQSDATLDGMDAWNKSTHGRSGLIDRVKASTVTEEQAEAALIEWMSQYVPKGKSPMCGNSICQDRRFMARTMPRLEEFFHYRNLDVSTLKELAKRWKPSALEGLKKAGKHTALADIQESIDELVHYRATLLNV